MKIQTWLPLGIVWIVIKSITSIFNAQNMKNSLLENFIFSNRITFNFLTNSLAAVQSEYCLLICAAITNEEETVKEINVCSDLVLFVFMYLCVYVFMCICICKFSLISHGFIFCKVKFKLYGLTNIYVHLAIMTIICFQY